MNLDDETVVQEEDGNERVLLPQEDLYEEEYNPRLMEILGDVECPDDHSDLK